MKRSEFIKTGLKAGMGLALAGSRSFAFGRDRSNLTILYTNDWHSRIDPFPMDGGKYQGLGGASKRAALINKIRQEEEHVLLLDAGDMFQGTPYFNFYKGELEFKIMSQMGYDAVTLGNHDFDAGIDGLNAQMKHAKFDFINANYRFADRALSKRIIPYKIYRKGPFKIGVIGVGIKLENLVPKHLCGDTIYTDPIVAANKWAHLLKENKKCDLVICLSHLGFSYQNNKVSDIHLAQNSSNIDLILGGHTHTFLNKPHLEKNQNGRLINICQTGWAGINLGKIDYKADTDSSVSAGLSSLVKIC